MDRVRGFLARAGACVLLIGLCVAAAPRDGAAQGTGDGLKGQLRALAEAEGLEVRGLERLGDASARVDDGGKVADRLQSLLFGYNYMLIHESDGRIAGVRIMGVARARHATPRQIAVPVTRRGIHHEVDAVLVGPAGAWLRRRLIVDTGASTVVLPASALAPLGFRAADLAEGWSETAGGRVRARRGLLASVALGQAIVRDVAVTFIDDERIGGTALLGMSFLDRFRLTIDDAAGQILLSAK